MLSARARKHVFRHSTCLRLCAAKACHPFLTANLKLKLALSD